MRNSSNDLLRAALAAFNDIPNRLLKNSGEFTSTYDIAAAIDKYFKNEGERVADGDVIIIANYSEVAVDKAVLSYLSTYVTYSDLDDDEDVINILCAADECTSEVLNPELKKLVDFCNLNNASYIRFIK